MDVKKKRAAGFWLFRTERLIVLSETTTLDEQHCKRIISEDWFRLSEATKQVYHSRVEDNNRHKSKEEDEIDHQIMDMFGDLALEGDDDLEKFTEVDELREYVLNKFVQAFNGIKLADNTTVSKENVADFTCKLMHEINAGEGDHSAVILILMKHHPLVTLANKKKDLLLNQ